MNNLEIDFSSWFIIFKACMCMNVYIIICTLRIYAFVNEYGCMYMSYFITIIYFCFVIVYNSFIVPIEPALSSISK